MSAYQADQSNYEDQMRTSLHGRRKRSDRLRQSSAESKYDSSMHSYSPVNIEFKVGRDLDGEYG